MLRLLPFLMLIVPITEIAVFILVGQWIGVLPTIALVILTAVAGASLLRHQGMGLALKLRREMEAGRVPGRELANGAMMLVAGVLLLTPGFVTDTLGFLLFLPPVRTRVFEFLAKRIKFTSPQNWQNQNGGRGNDANTIDLDSDDYERDDDMGSEAAHLDRPFNPDKPFNPDRPRTKESPWNKKS